MSNSLTKFNQPNKTNPSKPKISQLDNNSLANVKESVAPDSTTSVEEREMPGFVTGQDVLVKQKDGCYYFGTIVQVDHIRDQCLVKFGDNTENWAIFPNVTKLSTSEQEDLLCVVCKKSSPKNKKEIRNCDQCGRGYHLRCHQPEIPVNCQKEGSSWICKRCIESDSIRLKKSTTANKSREPLQRNTELPSSSVKTLPYDLASLNWDPYHRVNAEHTYCYCGSHGEWYKQMLQCRRCRQWFHEKCLDCLQFPLFCGDRFYVFVCAICNYGKDFLCRLELKWVDLVHLMLFNLTAYNSKKYFDLDSVVVPYINENWHLLQLPPKIYNVRKQDRREHILSILSSNRNRFKSGREIKKCATVWGLRVRLPPPTPLVTLPTTGLVTEDFLHELWQENKRLQIVNYNSSSNNVSESESTPEPDEPDFKLLRSSFHGQGIAKKSVPFKKMSLQRRKKLLSMTNKERERILKRPRRSCTLESGVSNDDEGKKGERCYPKRLSLDSSCKSSSNNKNSDSLPPTPPTSVSAPPTPPASGSTSIISDLSNDFSETASNCKTLKHKSLLELECHTPCDTSGDETSSKSTLDLIIPPLKDFEGKNNPFLTLLRNNNDTTNSTDGKKRRSKDAITLPLPLTAVIPGRPVMKPKKRQLSEKDIFIGPNGEVKRRRFRRNTNRNLSNYMTQTASKTAAVHPARPDTLNSNQLSNCMDYRRLRQRPEKTSAEKEKSNPPTPKPSPVKQEPDIDMDELKTSVNMYFGAANRIAGGEKFGVKAKRIGPTGKIEYLIEWEGLCSGMT